MADMKKSTGKRWALWGGLAAVVILVIGAAFVGGRLLAKKQPSGVRMPKIVVERPKELPDRAPTTTGIIARIEGKIITIEKPKPGSGEVAVLTRGQEGNVTEEILVTQETTIYRDKPIKLKPGEKPPPGEVEKIELADLRVDEIISVWGEKRGGRVVAEVIHVFGPVIGQ